MAFSAEHLERIRERINLVELIAEAVEVKRFGRRHVALCPFHSEKTPSFNINEEEGFYKCFGCGKHGDCFSFLMEHRRFSFPEAVQYLADRAGVELPQKPAGESSYEARGKQTRSELRRICRLAQEFYHAQLNSSSSGEAGRRYFAERGLQPKTIETFRLGFAPGGGKQLISHVLQALGGEFKDHQTLLKLSGVFATRKDGDFGDFFNRRAIFPIQRSDGTPIAFGGRVVVAGTNAPKYINTIETPIYQKRKTFYGMSQAYQMLRHERTAFLVEGYMDVLSLHQVGITHTIATCGTALTEEHAQLLKRMADRVVVIFDGDSAGRKAAAQCFVRFLNTGIAVDAALLPDGEDPDTVAQMHGAEGIQRLVAANKKPLLEVYLDFLLEELGAGAGADSAAPAVRGKVAGRMAQVLSTVLNPVEQEILRRDVAEYLGISDESLRSLIYEIGAAAQQSAAAQRQTPQYQPRAREGYQPAPARQFRQGAHVVEPQVQWSPSGKSGQTRNSQFEKRLLVAALTTPSQANVLMKMESFPNFSEAVQKLLNTIASMDLRGVATIAELDETHPDFIQELSAVKELFAAHQMDGESLFREALRQNRIRGSKPEENIVKAESDAKRLALLDEVEHLRSEESKIKTEQELAQVVQKKLLNKRNLEQLS